MGFYMGLIWVINHLEVKKPACSTPAVLLLVMPSPGRRNQCRRSELDLRALLDAQSRGGTGQLWLDSLMVNIEKNRWRNQGETMVSHSEKDLHMVDKQHIDISDYRRVYT